MAKTSNPAVQVAKAFRRNIASEPITLSTGDKAFIRPVTVAVVDAATSKVKDPEVPIWHNPEKDRDEENPSDPKYLRELSETGRKRGMAAFDVMIMFGVELVDGVPDKAKWLGKLKLMERQELLDLKTYDLEDAIDLEFLYKKYIAVDNSIIGLVGEVSGITAEDITTAEDSFPGT